MSDPNAASAATAAPAAPAAAPAAPASPAASVLAAAEPTLSDLVPEKYRTNKDDGTFDQEGSLRKLASGYGELAKRLGGDDKPPATPEEYVFDGMPEGFDVAKLKGDEKFAGFLKGAHAKGLSNAQVSYVLNEYLQRAGSMTGGAPMTAEKATEALRGVWKDDAAFKANTAHAFKAASAYGQRAGVSMEDMEAAGLSNNPVFLRLMAAIGPELREDSPPNAHEIGGTGGEDIATDRRKLAEMKTTEPGYAALKAKVDGWYARRHGTAAVA